jgi:hypothetical protein
LLQPSTQRRAEKPRIVVKLGESFKLLPFWTVRWPSLAELRALRLSHGRPSMAARDSPREAPPGLRKRGESPLALLVARVAAQYAHDAVAAHNLAVAAHLLDGGTNFHRCCL